MAEIFLVEDNENLREAVVSYLELDDHEVVQFDRVRGVLEALRTRDPDLIILDVMLPDGDGFHLARRIRADHDVPILFLTARTAESDRITGFEVGGDDYVVKPFSPRELALRVRAILRRGAREQAPEVSRWRMEDHVLEIDRAAHRVIVDGAEATLTAAEWKILDYLAQNAGIVIDRSRLLGESLDYLAEGSERTIDTHVKNVRAKLGEREWIETVRGFGYRFSGEPG
jgi:two-component system phosphate regulon response regulator PhoB